MENQKLNMRLDSCREVLEAINELLGRCPCDQRLRRQLGELADLMNSLRDISETDMLRIERSVNNLFTELKIVFARPGWERSRLERNLH
jgi:hypothetical protein